MIDLSNIKRENVYKAVLTCSTEGDVEALFHDMLTEEELIKVMNRWDIAQSKLASGCSKRVLKQHHHASQDLIDRVVKELNIKKNPFGDMGYRRVFRVLFGPAHDEETGA